MNNLLPRRNVLRRPWPRHQTKSCQGFKGRKRECDGPDLRTGGWLWKVDSAVGKLTIERFRGWPNAPSHHYRVSNPDPYEIVTPVFAVQFAGANRTEWEQGPFAGAHGTVCVVLRPDGSVDWDSPAFPILIGEVFATVSVLVNHASALVLGPAVRAAAGRQDSRDRVPPRDEAETSRTRPLRCLRV
jgi:hypothetical protein